MPERAPSARTKAIVFDDSVVGRTLVGARVTCAGIGLLEAPGRRFGSD
jgi:hypothetical protein